MDAPKIYCSYTELWQLGMFVENPRNDNRHLPEHVELLAKVFNARGVRHPIIVSNNSGFIVAGHLRLLAAQSLGLESYPVDIQYFANEAEEYQFLSSDNNVARYAEFDKDRFRINLEELNIEIGRIDIEEIGLIDFEVEKLPPKPIGENTEIDTDNFGNDLEHICPKCGFEFNE